MAQVEDTDRGQVQERMSDLITCPHCGHSNVPHTRYCDSCGASLAGAKTVAASESATPQKKGLFARLFRRR